MLLLAEILRARLDELDMDQQVFARRVGIPPTKLSAVMTGRRPLSRRRLKTADRWCEVLKLSGYSAERLLDAMHLAAATPRLRELVERQDRDVEALRAENARLEAWRDVVLRAARRSDPPIDQRE